ncbi:uncharacterized protein EI90DRAFT_3117330 [Cantharellus anzutake]|uniref:uncharacterized protein n=1 Tax=Cantharellus anzutake TaxID=1750568 RepID=UPI0019047989|nr:uncharacterized protein EI90DRAFT_3117330 [Cantharellus anzutake]KAF8339506.1 hypothetical protein EI90DRAFT_3117330 [Cantharellus anzutake]
MPNMPNIELRQTSTDWDILGIVRIVRIRTIFGYQIRIELSREWKWFLNVGSGYLSRLCAWAIIPPTAHMIQSFPSFEDSPVLSQQLIIPLLHTLLGKSISFLWSNPSVKAIVDEQIVFPPSSSLSSGFPSLLFSSVPPSTVHCNYLGPSSRQVTSPYIIELYVRDALFTLGYHSEAQMVQRLSDPKAQRSSHFPVCCLN